MLEFEPMRENYTNIDGATYNPDDTKRPYAEDFLKIINNINYLKQEIDAIKVYLNL
jgi:hypothetical protein